VPESIIPDARPLDAFTEFLCFECGDAASGGNGPVMDLTRVINVGCTTSGVMVLDSNGCGKSDTAAGSKKGTGGGKACTAELEVECGNTQLPRACGDAGQRWGEA